MITKSQGQLENFAQMADTVSSANNAPKWFQEIRTQSLSRFLELGIPTTKDEEWKYTSVASLAGVPFKLALKSDLAETAAFDEYAQNDEIRIVLVNGFLSPKLSFLPKNIKGLTYLPLQDALKSHAEEIKNILGRHAPGSESAFVALNKALVQEGVFIKVDPKAVCEKLIHIVHVTSNPGAQVAVSSRAIISVGKSSQASILQSHVAFDDKISYFTNALTDIFIDENATLNYCKAQKESLNAYHIDNTRVWQERSSNLEGFSIMCGGKLTRNNLDIIIDGEGANSTLNGLYCLNGAQHADNHTSVDHRFPNCTSNQLYKGILNGSSRAVFNGKIFVKPIAQKTNSYQLNKNLLMGKDCRVDTKPQLEIFADDVKCTHGATIGQLDPDEIFYLQTRAIPKDKVIQMLARGFVDELLNMIKDEEINRKLHLLLEPSLAQLQ